MTVKALRGVNLGGWLVAERWMTPDLFQGVEGNGELALSQELGVLAARERLEAHRSAFITAEDFHDIKKRGFDFVRLPVGYWLFDGTDNFIDGEIFIDRAFMWAEKYHLGIILDFHGLQGSQNGHDHSGQVGKVRFYRRRNTSRALKTFEYMCQKYGHHPNLLGIELINEPKLNWCLYRLLSYYDKAYSIAQRLVSPEVKIIVSDGFRPRRMARALARRKYGSQLVLDIHLYLAFKPVDEAISFAELIAKTQNDWGQLIADIQGLMPILIGEWSAGLPGQIYNGYGRETEHVHKYFTMQQSLFDNSTWAHSYWSYKAKGYGVWSLKDSYTVLYGPREND